MLHLEVVAAVGQDEAVAGPSERVADVSPEEPGGAEDGNGDSRGLFFVFEFFLMCFVLLKRRGDK